LYFIGEYIKFTISTQRHMSTPSIIFYCIFGIPYFIFMYWLVKQDKQKYAWGIALITVIAVLAIYVSQKASKVAIDNYQQHQIDSRQIEHDEKMDSLNHK
jgi:ABC-type phosphate transport system permease subunit